MSLALLVAGIGCVNETPANPYASPDPSLITVFFPQDGLVYVRGSPGALSNTGRFPFIKITPHPKNGTGASESVNADGSFVTNLAAGYPSTLEFAGATSDMDGATFGGSTYIEVPPERARREAWVCCSDTPGAMGHCQPPGLTECAAAMITAVCDPRDKINDTCAQYSGQTISIAADAFTLTPPDAHGNVTLRARVGAVPPLTLVKIENRGHRGFGGPAATPTHKAIIADELGQLSLSFKGSANDEIVIEVLAIDGVNRSREHSLFVPDADFQDLDVTGVFAVTPIAPPTATLGVRFVLGGADGRGICPPSSAGVLMTEEDDTEDPALCFSAMPGSGLGVNGGLDYSHVVLDHAVINTNNNLPNPHKTPISAFPVRKFTDGDVLAGGEMVFVVVDNSAVAGSVDGDPQQFRFEAAKDVINSLRKRDFGGLIISGKAGMGDQNQVVQDLTALAGNGKQTLISALANAANTPAAGDGDILGAIALAAGKFAPAGPTTNTKTGRIVVIAASTVLNGTNAIAALNAVQPPVGSTREYYPTFIVTKPQAYANCPMSGDCMHNLTCLAGKCTPPIDLETIANFSGGAYRETQTPVGLVNAAQSIEGLLSGSFVLYFDFSIPEGLDPGKLVSISFVATVTLGSGVPVKTPFSGQIELR